MSAGSSPRAGFARADITPAPGVRLAGFLHRPLPADRVEDPLTLTAVALESGDDALLLLCCDVLGLPPAHADALRGAVAAEAGLTREQVWFAPSHTHSGPVTVPDAFATAVEREWFDRFLLSARESAVRARADAVPARLRVAELAVALGVNRRPSDADGRVTTMAEAPERPVDHRVVAVACERASDGAPLGVLLNVACHPVACGPDTRYVSADYPGEARAQLEASGFGPCAFTLGACGDVNPRGGLDADAAHARALGRSLAEAVTAALDQAEPLPADGLAVGCAALAVDYAAAEVVGHMPANFQELAGEDGVAALVERQFPWSSPLDGDGRVEVELVLARLGDLVLAGVPYEVFAATGRQLVAALGERSLVISLANGTIGYLPPCDETPRGGYEVHGSHLVYRLPGPPPGDTAHRILDVLAVLAASEPFASGGANR